MKSVYSFVVLFVLGIVAIASAQDRPAAELTPIFSVGTHTRTFVYPDGRAGYASSGTKHNLEQKGFELSFNGTGRLSVKFAFANGSGLHAREFYNFTDGRSFTNRPYANFTDGTTVSVKYGNRTIGACLSYEILKQVSFQFGITNTRFTETLDAHFTNGANPDDNSVITDSFWAPTFGARYRPELGRVGANLEVSASPWVRYTQSYSDRMSGYPDYNKSGHTTARQYEYNIGGSVSIVKHRLALVGGVHGAEIRTKDAYFMFGNPYNQNPTPQHDRWHEYYFGLRYSR